MITLRPYHTTDTEELLQLFYDTVHHVNSAHYTAEQLDAWAPSPDHNLEQWKKRFPEEKTIVALFDNKVAGFGNLGNNGKSIGMLYVHKDFQRKGVAYEILKTLEQMLKESGVKISSTEASITARPFFERNGYEWEKDNRKVLRGVEVLNFIMKKQLL